MKLFNTYIQKYSFLLTLLFLSTIVYPLKAQDWKVQSKVTASQSMQSLNSTKPIQFNAVSVDINELKQVLNSSAKSSNVAIIVLPMPYGGSESFRFEETPMMETELAAKYPEIKTYTARGLTNKNHFAKIDIGYMGFHAMVFTEEGKYFVDPIDQQSFTNYISYYRKDLSNESESFNCYTHADEEFLKQTEGRIHTYKSSGSVPVTFRNYRLALACTGEYSKAATGLANPTKEQVLSKMVTTMNRVNGVYETDVAVTMTLVANNDTLIFLTNNSDPYTNNDGFSMLNQNQATVDSHIGTANYDIGHVFSTGGGGVAGLGVVCSSSGKARGVTGSGNPVGDGFDIDYVAHEMGHQFGANHTFNSVASSCGGGNRNASTAYEPGSGTTIMAYAGICGSDNIAANSNAYFHTKSLDEINAFINAGGNSCATITISTNTPPLVEAGPDYTIPKSTPFVLEGSAIDPDSNLLTYSWEQFDLGPSGSPNSPSGNAPLFRFFPPVSTPVRIFPKLSDILNNTQTKGEILPSYARTMKFRLIARDNQFAGATANDFTTITVDGNSGPFEITFGNISDTLIAATPELITWNVNNTNQAPVNCSHVNIVMSSDGGQTFPHVLAANTPNDGSEQVSLPALNASNVRIKIEAVGNIFFDINPVNLILANPIAPDFKIISNPITNVVCPEDTVEYRVKVLSILGFNDSVQMHVSDLPNGAIASIHPSKLVPGDSATIKITTTGLNSAAYNFTIQASSGTINHGVLSDFNVKAKVTTANSLSTPVNNSLTVTASTNFKWNTVIAAIAYQIQMSTNDSFSNVVIDTILFGSSNTTFQALTLSPATEYFWRVRSLNDCGNGPFSVVRRFVTVGIPAIPVLTLNGISENEIKIEWSDALNETGYAVERSDNDSLNFVLKQSLNQNVLSYTDTGLSAGVIYFYRVKSVNTSGSSAYSNIVNATLVSGISKEKNKSDLSVFPNPANAEINFVLNAHNQTGIIEIVLSDQLGRIVRELQAVKDQNIYQTEINIQDLEHGVYFLRVSINHQHYFRTVIK